MPTPALTSTCDQINSALTAKGISFEHTYETETDATYLSTDSNGEPRAVMILTNEDGAIVYIGYDIHRERRDIMEGISEDDSKCMVDLKNVAIVVMWLSGEFH